MTDTMKALDPRHTAMLSLDLQQGILASVPPIESLLNQAATTLELGRKAGYLILHVGLGFGPGHLELPTQAGVTPFEQVKNRGGFVIGTPVAAFHPQLLPDPLPEREGVIYKQRISAFSHNHLQLILRAQEIHSLVFFGVATSGIVLSTLRQAFDLDFRSVILSDACFDADPEVHRVLLEKVFPRQAEVMTVADFATAVTPA